ncbi:hypothetical protein [Arcobacter sp. CECT 8985]|uniref:hypothetical protein n=1 Tax=Arcobacter sp. CECT 8985 TaxID=1935424 RepID=UPI00100AE22C|nr:hypothetical protein [Arcobacter sp. CECT 8985]RXJ87214.1 hypothetical protein CRU93_04710 [Arcobacter sp. CECT 8985]
MNLINKKKAFITFELLIVLIISSLVIINSFISIKDIYTLSKKDESKAIYKVDLLSSKIILQKTKDYLNNLHYKNHNLLIKNSLFLENIDNFKISKNNSFTNISFRYKNSYDVNWVFK